jgi:hypothetical protein
LKARSRRRIHGSEHCGCLRGIERT